MYGRYIRSPALRKGHLPGLGRRPPYVPTVCIRNLNGTYEYVPVPLQDIDNTFQYSGTISWTKGNHSIKAGIGLIRRQARNVQSASAVGAYSFNLPTDSNSDELTQQNNQLASALVGAYASETRNFNLFPPDYRSWEPNGFAQDSWKVNPRLTVLYGLRYDVFTPFTEAHNHISNFDFPAALGLTAATIGNALKIAGVNGVNNQVNIPTDYSNVARILVLGDADPCRSRRLRAELLPWQLYVECEPEERSIHVYLQPVLPIRSCGRD